MDLGQQLLSWEFPDNLKSRLLKFKGREIPSTDESEFAFKLKFSRVMQRRTKLDEIDIFKHPAGLTLEEKKEIEDIVHFIKGRRYGGPDDSGTARNLLRFLSRFPYNEEALEETRKQIAMFGTIIT